MIHGHQHASQHSPKGLKQAQKEEDQGALPPAAVKAEGSLASWVARSSQLAVSACISDWGCAIFGGFWWRVELRSDWGVGVDVDVGNVCEGGKQSNKFWEKKAVDAENEERTVYRRKLLFR